MKTRNPLRLALLRAARVGIALASVAVCAQAQFDFQAAVPLATPTSPDDSTAGDFDGDGDLDLATTADAPDRVVIRFNGGNGTFSGPSGVQTGGGTSPHGIAAGDLDGDGDVDLLVSLKNASSVRVLINTGGTFGLGATAAVGAEPRTVRLADLDGDGDRDAAVVNRSSDSVSVLLNQGNATFSVTSYAAGSDPRTLALGDLTGDRRADIAVASHDTREMVLLANNGSGAFAPLATLFVGSGLRPEGSLIADLDGDGDQDVAATTGGPDSVTVFKNTGGGTFGAPAHFATSGLDSSFLVAADLDVDGDLDVATSNTDSNNLSLLANDGTGAFGAPQHLAVGAGPGHVLAADLDGTGSMDLVATNETAGNISILLNARSGGKATTYCIAAPNSAGPGALIGHRGSLSIATNTFTLTISGGVAGRSGLFFYGPLQTQVPLGDGFRCVGGRLFRLQPAVTMDAAGMAARRVDFTVAPAAGGPGRITPGSHWNFQFVYRDPLGPGGTGTNLSNALSVTFAP